MPLDGLTRLRSGVQSSPRLPSITQGFPGDLVVPPRGAGPRKTPESTPIIGNGIVAAGTGGSGDRVTEERPGADQPPASDAQWAAEMFAALGYHALPPISADRAPAFQALHQWLDSWRGIGDLERGMHRQGFDLHLAREADEGWRATFFGSGKVHSLPAPTGTAWERTPWLAVQRAAARTLDKMERADDERATRWTATEGRLGSGRRRQPRRHEIPPTRRTGS